MQITTNLKDLNPGRGDVILLYNRETNPQLPSLLGTFGEYFKNEIDHKAFGLEEAIVFSQAYRGIIPITHAIIPAYYLKDESPQTKYGRGFPVELVSDRNAGFQSQYSEFIMGEERILSRLESKQHLLPYLEIARKFINLNKKN